jgi:hypothetical protein
MQNKRVDVRTKFRNEEGNPMSHEPGNEVDIARQAVELGDRDWAALRPRLCERRRQLRSTIERIAPFACFDLDELGGNVEALARREPRKASRCPAMPSPDRPC